MKGYRWRKVGDCGTLDNNAMYVTLEHEGGRGQTYGSTIGSPNHVGYILCRGKKPVELPGLP